MYQDEIVIDRIEAGEVKFDLDLHPPHWPCQGHLQRQGQLRGPEQELPVLDPDQCHPTPPETVDNDI